MEKQHINQSTDVITLVSKACAQVQGFEAMQKENTAPTLLLRLSSVTILRLRSVIYELPKTQ